MKPTISKQFLEDAAQKAASVRSLLSTNRTILAGLLGTTSVWHPDNFSTNLRRALPLRPPTHKINIGCALAHGAFEHHTQTKVSPANRALIFFLLRLITRLNRLGPTPSIDLLEYLRQA